MSRAVEDVLSIPVRHATCSDSFLKLCILCPFDGLSAVFRFRLRLLGGRFRDMVEWSREWGLQRRISVVR